MSESSVNRAVVYLNLCRTEAACAAGFSSAEGKNHPLSAVCRVPIHRKKLEVGNKIPQVLMSPFQK